MIAENKAIPVDPRNKLRFFRVDVTVIVFKNVTVPDGYASYVRAALCRFPFLILAENI
jgi:hypothetical protein